jgi:hypothetical protein
MGGDDGGDGGGGRGGGGSARGCTCTVDLPRGHTRHDRSDDCFALFLIRWLVTRTVSSDLVLSHKREERLSTPRF